MLTTDRSNDAPSTMSSMFDIIVRSRPSRRIALRPFAPDCEMSCANAARTNSSPSIEVDEACATTASTVGKFNACVGSSSVESLARADMAWASSGSARCIIPIVSSSRHERAFP